MCYRPRETLRVFVRFLYSLQRVLLLPYAQREPMKLSLLLQDYTVHPNVPV